MKIRIGKELRISWSILTQGENKPLEGRNLRLYLQEPNRQRRTLEFTTDDNTILVVIPANTLTRIGRYALILTENEGQEGQTAVDANPAFTLVETTREEDTNTTEAPNLEVATINLTTGDLTLRMVIQELFDGKDGGDMKTGDILPVLRDGELHRVSAKIDSDWSEQIESLEAKIEENTANIAGASADASAALKAARGAQETATTASDNAAKAQELSTESKTVAEQAQGTATNALSEAIEAKSNAATAFSAASSAQSTADAAQEENSSQNDRMDSIERMVNNNQERISAVENKNTEQDTRMDKFESRIDPDIAGRVWNEDNATSKAESYYGSLKALRDLPKRLGLGRYLVTDNRQKFKLHPNDSHKYLDGSPAALDGSEGQCMWCWNGFYANIWHEGSRLIKAVTFDKPIGGETSVWIPSGGISWLGAGVMDRTNNILCSVINDSPQFRGGGGVALNPASYSKAPAADSPQITMLGMPATSISTTNFGNYARKRGEGWEANWFVARFVVEFLFEIIMGTENSQEAFSTSKDANGLYQGGFDKGVTDMPDWNGYNGYYPVIPTSVGLEAGDDVCLVPYEVPKNDGIYHTFNVPVFFGLVGAGFGHMWQWVRGLIIDADDKFLVYVTPSMYADYDPNTVADKIMVAECKQTEGFIMRKSYQGLCCMATKLGGSATTRFADTFYIYYNKNRYVRAAGGGGKYYAGQSAGASCTVANYDATIMIQYCSAPLCYFEEDPIIPESEKIEL